MALRSPGPATTAAATPATPAPEEAPVPVDHDIDAWPNDPDVLAAAEGEGVGIDHRFLSRHLHAAEVWGGFRTK